MPGDADVVDEDVEPIERCSSLGDDPVRPRGLRQVGRDVGGLPDPGRNAPPARDDARSFRDEEAHRLQPDPSGRAGHEAPLFAQSEVHERG